MELEQYDVIIIGSGIAGPFLGLLLSRQGKRVLILEAKAELKSRVCGEYLCPSGVLLLKENGIFSELKHEYLPIYGMKISNSWWQQINTTFPLQSGQKTFGLSLQRKYFEEEMRELFCKAGGTLVLNYRATEFECSTNEWIVSSRENKSVYKGKLLIGADGKKSNVAQKISTILPIKDKRLALHVELESKEENERKGEMHLFNDGNYIGLDPIGPKLTNVTLVCYPKDIEKKGGGNSAQFLLAYLNSSPLLRDKFILASKKDLKFHSVWPISHKVKRIVGKNWSLIGDAAGFFDPLTGEGIYQAMWDADQLSKSLALIHFNQQELPEKLQKALDLYASRKKQNFRQKKYLNQFFQFVIRRQWAVKILTYFLLNKKERGDVFVGIIGNVYTPLKGLIRLIKVDEK